MQDTIFALATAAGRAAVAIVRVSGPGARPLLEALCGAAPIPRKATVRPVVDARGEMIDQALVLWFPSPGSFTGEDVFELQLHGGPAIVDAATSALIELGARLAEPGEFTRRAFEAGRLELSQAEAVADLVDAETEAQRRQALQQFGGALSRRGDAWREILLHAAAFLGAQIDFPDEELPQDLAERAMAPIAALAREIEMALNDMRGERVRDGFRIALIGCPNAGKSSLFNALVGRDAAIVTAVPGTTRDIIEGSMVIEGYKVILADTAGLRETSDAIETEGVRRARAWAAEADLRLWLVDSALENDEQEIQTLLKPKDILVFTKADLAADRCDLHPKPPHHLDAVSTSVLRHNGCGALHAALKARVVEALSGSEFPGSTRIRHRILLKGALSNLERGLSRRAFAPELIAEDLRLAARALDQLAGRVTPEDVLDRIFASFCIGK